MGSFIISNSTLWSSNGNLKLSRRLPGNTDPFVNKYSIGFLVFNFLYINRKQTRILNGDLTEANNIYDQAKLTINVLGDTEITNGSDILSADSSSFANNLGLDITTGSLGSTSAGILTLEDCLLIVSNGELCDSGLQINPTFPQDIQPRVPGSNISIFYVPLFYMHPVMQ